MLNAQDDGIEEMRYKTVMVSIEDLPQNSWVWSEFRVGREVEHERRCANHPDDVRDACDLGGARGGGPH